ncbi:MAG TPA: HAMP domain-containing sensor histidine kinase [Gemmatimonadales bacterium]|nr:HAMP domain-containing sensor histidine kinase [Gemmatimonadales bacterium]
MSVGLRHRLFLALLGLGTLPVAAALVLLAGQMRSAASPTGYRAALDSIAASGAALIGAVDSTRLDSAGRSALRSHEQTLSHQVTMGRRAATLTRAAAAFAAAVTLGVAGLVVAGSLVVARRWARDVSAPIEELVDWMGRVERREPLPATHRGGAPEFAALRDAVRALAAALERARHQELEQERLRAFRETARHVAHEMRSPLGALRLAVRQLAGDSPAAEVLADETARLEAMAREFAEFGRLPEGPAAPVELGELVERVIAGCVPAGCPVARNVEPGLVVEGHYEPLRRAVENLVRNAVAFSPERGFTVSAQRRGPVVELTVRDFGPGVPAAMTERIFEPYVTTRAEGTGLGLTLARQTALAHGGSLTVAAPPGGGAAFTLVLPERS